MGNLYFDLLNFEEKQYILIASQKGLQFVGLFDGKDPLLEKFTKGYNLLESKEFLKKYKNSLLNYFQGNEEISDVEFDLVGTDFQKEVWKELLKVKHGEAISYKELAERLGRPKAIRAVANAVGKNPLLIFVPCHRIIGSNGKLTGFRSGLTLKKRLLDLENIEYK